MTTSEFLPKVTIIIPNWNTRRWLPGCLEGLRRQTYQDFVTILIDNGSTDNSVAFVKENYPEVEILAFDMNKGFAPAVNAGIGKAQSEYIALLNVDTEPQPNWLASLVETMDKSSPDVGWLASKMLSLENPQVIDDAGNSLSWYGSATKRGNGESAENYGQMEEVFSASGGAALFRREFFEEVGDFDESFVSYLEDVDLGLRGRLLGYRCLYVPAAEVLHQWGGANIPRPKYVYFSTRNRLTMLTKSIPISLLLKHGHTLIYGQFYFFIAYKRPFYSLAGLVAFILALPRILSQRRQIQRHRKISDQKLERLLANELGMPGLGELLKNKFK